MDGTINNPQWTATFDGLVGPAGQYGPMSLHKIFRMFEIGKITLGSGPAIFQTQLRLSLQTEYATYEVDQLLKDVMRRGGEGLMLRKPESVWTPHRSWNLLKLKSWLDSEALVTGYTWGKGKLEGLMGAMTVKWRGKGFELSGFTDEERYLFHEAGRSQARAGTPGTIVSNDIFSNQFPRGSKVTFRYRELTRDGIPKEARYWRTEL
jgi:DNA ligase-1